jgi:PleD family two-component response regulator
MHHLRTEVIKMSFPHDGAGPGAIVTISVGLATAWPTSPHAARQLMKAADAKLYAAKLNGRNCVFSGSRIAAMAE